MENTSFEFLTLNKQEKAQVIFEMVDTLMQETCLPKDICIAIIAEYKKYSVFQIEQYIKMYNPKFYYYAAYYEDDKLVYTNQIDKELIKISKSKLVKPVLQHPSEIPDLINFFKTIIRDYYEAISWNDLCHNVNISVDD